MSQRARFPLQLGVVALIALLFTVAPGGTPALGLLLDLLMIAFFTALAAFGFRLYKEHRFALDSLTDRQRLVLYAAVGLAFLTFAATRRLFELGGAGVLAWFALLALCSYGGYWVLVRSRRME